MQREYSLDTAAVSYSSYRESFAYAAVLLGNYCTLEYLDTELVAFGDAYVYLNCVTYVELRCVSLKAVLCNEFSSWFSDILVSAYPPRIFCLRITATFAVKYSGLPVLMSLCFSH